MQNFNQKGIALMAIIFLLVVISFTGIIFISLSSSSATQAVNEVRSNQAFYIAEAGMERTRGYLAGKDASCPVGGCTCASINGNALFTNKSIGSGQFTVTATTIGGQCTLTSTGGVPTIASGTTQRVVTYTAITTIQDAWAVGYNVTGVNRPFMAHWDGSAWTNLTASAPSIGGNNLMEVSMISSSEGWAISNAGDFIKYNGSNWALSGVFNSTATLNSIYMNATNDGWAVGSSGEIDRLDAGGVWYKYPYVAQGSNNAAITLLGVYCMNSSYCWAVGNRTSSGSGQSNIYFWNGTNWSPSSTAGINGANFRYVSCVDTTHCWAVGSSGGEIIFWNGASWAFQDNGNSSLWGVDCVDTTRCWAVGRTLNGGNQVNSYTSPTWVLQTPPTGQNLTFVSCVSLTDCWASGAAGVLIHWNGILPWTLTTVGTVQINSLSQFRSGNSTTSWKEVIQ